MVSWRAMALTTSMPCRRPLVLPLQFLICRGRWRRWSSNPARTLSSSRIRRSQGKNSLLPMGCAIRDLRPRIGANRPICVFHVDQPSNDFNSLFEVLTSDPSRYELSQANVFPCAVRRSFYEQVLPSQSVHLGWSSSAAMAQPSSVTHPRPLLVCPQHWNCTGGVRNSGSGRLGKLSLVAGARDEAWRSHGGCTTHSPG